MANVLRVEDRIGFGAYADIFFLPSSTPPQVVKVFRRKVRDASGQAVRALYQAEVSAYERAHTVPELSAMVATYFGPYAVTEVRGSSTDLSPYYHLGCAYAVERLSGQEVKVAAYKDYDWFSDLMDKFEAHGIGYAADASLFPSSDETFKIIDIATHDAAAHHHRLLFDEKGYLQWDIPEGPVGSER
jgi:hypothetical protein